MFQKLFTWKTLQSACSEAFGFSDCTLLQDIGPHKKGDQICLIWYATETAELSFFRQGELQADGSCEMEEYFGTKAVLQIAD